MKLTKNVNKNIELKLYLHKYKAINKLTIIFKYRTQLFFYNYELTKKIKTPEIYQ